MSEKESMLNFLPLVNAAVQGSTGMGDLGMLATAPEKPIHWCDPSTENGRTESPTDKKLELGISLREFIVVSTGV